MGTIDKRGQWIKRFDGQEGYTFKWRLEVGLDHGNSPEIGKLGIISQIDSWKSDKIDSEGPEDTKKQRKE